MWLRKPRYTFWVATANIMATPRMNGSYVMVSMEAVMHHPASIIGWQEIEPEYYKDILESFGDHWSHFNTDTNTPISVDTRIFSVLSFGKLLVLPGVKKLHANRHLTWVIVRHKRTGRVFVLCNFHQVSGAFDGNHDGTDLLRKKEWYEARAIIRKELLTWVTAGYSVIGLGDYNRLKNTVVGTIIDGRPITYNVSIGLDYIYSVFLRRLKAVAKDVIQTRSDHSAKFCKFKVW